MQPLFDLEGELAQESRAILENQMPTRAQQSQVVDRFYPSVEKLVARFEDLVSRMDSWSGVVAREVQLLREQLRELRQEREILYLREKTTHYADLILSPDLVVAERFYEVKGMDPYVERVLFDKEIVEQIMWNEAPTYRTGAVHILRAIFRGKVGHSEIGITSFSADTSVYKVRTTGDAGIFRVAGYFVGRDYYVTSLSVGGSHGGAITTRLMEDVRHERIRRGHAKP